MRQFLAIPIPEDVRAVLDGVRRHLSDGSPWRWVGSSGVHLTLRFLGEVPEERDRRLREVWESAVSGACPFRCATGRLGAFPSTRRPRVLFVNVEEVGSRGRLLDVADRLSRAAHRAGFEVDPRRTHPHLTLARCPRGSRALFPDPAPIVNRVEFSTDRIDLYRSDLTSAGARYTVLDSYRLGGGPHS